MTEATQEPTNALKEIGTAVRHSAIYGLGNILAKALGFLMLPLYTHYLAPRDFGLFELMDLSISVLGMVLQMGIAPALLRSYAAASTPAEKKKAVSTVYIFAGSTGLVTFLCGLILVRPVSNMLFGSEVPSNYLLLSFSSFVLSYVAGPFRIYLRAREASAKLVTLDTASTLLIFALNIFFVAGLKIGLLGVLMSPLIVNTIWTIVAGGSLLGIGLHFSRSLLSKMVRFGSPLILSNLAAFVLNFADRFFLQHFQSLEVVGLYAVGYKFGFMINAVLVQPFFQMWQARMYAIYNDEQHVSIFGQIFVLYSLLLTYAGLGMALFSQEIITLMAGHKFAAAGAVIPVISLAYVVCGVGTYLQTGLYLANRTKLIGVIGGIGAVISLALYYVLISGYGLLGAAWATVLSFGVVAIASYWCSRRVCPLGLDLHRVIAGCAIAILLYLVFQWWTPASPTLAIAAKLIALAAFPLLIWKAQVLSGAETAAIVATRANVYAVVSRVFRGCILGKKRLYDSSAEVRTPRPTIIVIAPQAPPYGGMALQAEKLVRLLRQEGYSVVYLASNLRFPPGLGFVAGLRGVRPFVRSIVMTTRLWAELRRANVVHVLAASWLYFFLVVAPAVLLARLSGKRAIINYRSGEAREFFRRYGFLAAPVLRLASEVTAPSGFLAEAIRARFGLTVRIVPNIVDLKTFRYRQRNRFQPRLLVTRHLEKMYGVDLVVRAFERVQKRFPEATLEIAGTGSEEGRLRQLVAESGLKNVHFCGHVPHADLPALYERSDILLNGSHVDNFPGSLVEASAAGLAVVSTNAGGIPAMYENGNTAVLVEPGDWQGLADGVQALIDTPSLGVRLTLAAFHLCRQCEWENVRELLYESYGFVAPTVEAVELRRASI
jgi:O-antigen/teichoic acid export membrane protein/glycosyltransferase involved in cell wall biosynthesis